MKLLVYQDDNEFEVGFEPPFIKLYETKSISFKLESENHVETPHLVVGNMKIELTLTESINNLYIYVASKSNYFINNVGLALIELVDDDDNSYDQLGSINVLSSKITIERLYSMLKYISEVDARLVHCCFSKTFLSNSGGKFEYTDLYFKLLHTEKTLNYLWDNRNKFKNQPCKRIKTSEVIKEFSPKDLIDDRAYGWLLSNLNELEFTVNPESTLINHYGKSLTAKHIATSVVEDDTNIFENQVIYTFLVSIKNFIESVKSKENYFEKTQVITNEFTDIVPFIQNFVSDKLNIKTQLITRINVLVNNCLKFVTLNFTKTYISNLRPRITQYVSRHNHYLMLYRLMDFWWNINASNLVESDSVNELLFSIKSMDKLYELFVLLKLIEALKTHGCDIVDSLNADFETFPSLGVDNLKEKMPHEIFNYYKFYRNNLEVKLYLEPTIFPYRVGIDEGELFIIDKSPDSRTAKKLTRAKHVRTPDYVLDIYREDINKRYVFIIDAKYSSYDTVLYKRLPSIGRSKEQKSKSGLVDKYLHGIRIYSHDSPKMVDGLFATYISGIPTNMKNKVIQGVANEFALDGDFPMSPFVDLIKFSPEEKSSDAEHELFISNVLKYVNK
jgi:hypothetical protein